MISASVENKKQFMSMLLKDDIFDKFLVRSISLRTSVTYDIDCTLNKDWFDSEEAENLEKYSSWADMRPIVFNLIKGKRLPGYMKIVLSAAPDAAEQIHKNAAALFINILFENNMLYITGGCSQKVFSLDKTLEQTWDETIQKFFKRCGIILELQ
jgi:hypothetical protein